MHRPADGERAAAFELHGAARGTGKQKLAAAIFQDEFDPVARRVGIERQIRAARLHYREHGDHPLGAAVAKHGDRLFARDAALTSQVVSQARARRGQFAVAHSRFAIANGDLVRRARGLLDEVIEHGLFGGA